MERIEKKRRYLWDVRLSDTIGFMEYFCLIVREEALSGLLVGIGSRLDYHSTPLSRKCCSQ